MTAKTYVGIDLHKTTLTIGVRDSIGELVNTTPFPTKCVDKIEHFGVGNFGVNFRPEILYKFLNLRHLLT